MNRKQLLPTFYDIQKGTLFSCHYKCYSSSVFLKINNRKALLIRDWESPIAEHRLPASTKVTAIYNLVQHDLSAEVTEEIIKLVKERGEDDA